jgi:hypothetical protein
VIPCNVRKGLACIDMWPHTGEEWGAPPHITVMSELEWDPSCLDFEWGDSFEDASQELEGTGNPLDSLAPSALFSEFGDHRKRVVAEHGLHFFDAMEDDFVEGAPGGRSAQVSEHPLDRAGPAKVGKEDPDFEKLRPNFMWPPVDITKKAWEGTAQFAKVPVSGATKKQCKPPHPALSAHRRDEAAAADTVCSDTPAIDGGETAAQVFVGTESAVCDARSVKSGKQLIGALEGNTAERGALRWPPSRLANNTAICEATQGPPVRTAPDPECTSPAHQLRESTAGGKPACTRDGRKSLKDPAPLG